jgi:hypothetical protein
MMPKKVFFIEQRDDKRYNVSRPNSVRASAVADTQAKAIKEARKMDLEATLHVERVRNIGPGRDKWRKI